jgi:predicted DNA-binding transcriptional regulator AlpA
MLLSDVEVAEMMSVSRNTVWRWVGSIDKFPQPVKIGGATRWRKADLDKYIADLKTGDQQVDVEEYIKKVAR